jgi:hypothetical protein
MSNVIFVPLCHARTVDVDLVKRVRVLVEGLPELGEAFAGLRMHDLSGQLSQWTGHMSLGKNLALLEARANATDSGVTGH